jgi:hypothetical protein
VGLGSETCSFDTFESMQSCLKYNSVSTVK